jgi:hypothetical protein
LQNIKRKRVLKKSGYIYMDIKLNFAEAGSQAAELTELASRYGLQRVSAHIIMNFWLPIKHITAGDTHIHRNVLPPSSRTKSGPSRQQEVSRLHVLFSDKDRGIHSSEY